MKTLLYITPNGVQYWQRNKSSWSVLSQAESTNLKGDLWILTELAEETFAEIQVPRLFGSNRTDLLKRQLKSRFPDTPYRVALPSRENANFIKRLSSTHQTLFAVDAATRIQSALGSQSAPIAGLWSSSLILAQLGQSKNLPSDFFIVMPSDGFLRIVFLKDKQPILSRLAPCGNLANERASEIARTLRHLENTRIVERSTHRYAVWVLGDPQDITAPLAALGLDVIASSTQSDLLIAHDWRFTLFDRVLKSPAQQMAPLRQRSSYLGKKLQLVSFAFSGIFLAAAAGVASTDVRTALQDRDSQNLVKRDILQLNQDIGNIDKKLKQIGVSPDLVRQAVAMDRENISSASTIVDTIQPVATALIRSTRIFSSIEQRISRFESRQVPDSDVACAVRSEGSSPDFSKPTQTKPTRVEIQLDLALPEDTPSRSVTQVIANFSAQLKMISGVQLLQDPVNRPSNEAITSSNQKENKSVHTWCLTVDAKEGV